MLRSITLLISLLAGPALAQFDPATDTITVTIGPIPIGGAIAICGDQDYFDAQFTCTQPLFNRGVCDEIGARTGYPTGACNLAAQDRGLCDISQDGQPIPTPRGCAAWLSQHVRRFLKGSRDRAITRQDQKARRLALAASLQEPLEDP